MSEPKVRVIKQASLSAECWTVQMFGTDACKTCKQRNKGCGGKNILKTGKNERGVSVLQSGLGDEEPVKETAKTLRDIQLGK